MLQINLHDKVPVLPFCSDKYFESAMNLSDMYGFFIWPHQNLAKSRLKLDTVSYP